MFTSQGYHERFEFFTIKHLKIYCGGEESMWRAYFSGQMDNVLMEMLSSVMSPEIRAAAWVMRSQIDEIRALFDEINKMVRSARVLSASESAPPTPAPSRE